MILITKTRMRTTGFLLFAGLAILASAQSALNAQVVISQIYGSGGNPGATYLNDYIELFNRGAIAQSLSGWSVQYASATGSGTWTSHALPNISINPGQYVLLQEATGGGGVGAALPTPDGVGTLFMATASGKVALCNSTTLLNGSCPTSSGAIQDLVGYGANANCNEGGANAPAPSSTNAVFRAAGGCTDSGNNLADFLSAAATPRNTASATNTCTAQTNPTGTGSVDRAAACRGTTSVTFSVSLNVGTNPTGTAHTVTGDFSSIGGPAAQVLGTGTGPYTFAFTPDVGTTPGLKTIPFTIQETAPLSRSGGGNFTLNVLDCSGINYTDIKISQVYGGGGNSGSTYKNDFVELFNVGANPVNLAGYSIQYASSGGGAFDQVTPLTGTIQAGHYYLIQEAQGNGGTTNLPTPDATGAIAMSSSGAHIVLAGSTSPILFDCMDPTIVDLVAYSTGANTCNEGTATPSLSNTTAAVRNGGGCVDTNNNSADFTILAPTPRNSAITGNCSGTPPTGSANPANPDPVCAGAQVILSVAVTPGASPASTGLAVAVNLSAIGGSAAQQFFDDGPGGLHGDAMAGDNTFTFNPTIPLTTTPGTKTMLATVSDAELRSSTTNVVINMVDRCFPSAGGIASPIALCTSGGDVDILVFVNPASTGNTNIQSVVADLISIGGSATQTLFDDATNGDRQGGDNTWTYRFAAGSLALGAYNIPWLVTDADNRTAAGANTLNIISCSSAASTVVISQLYGGGSNTGAPFAYDYIELFNRSASPVDIGGWSVQYSAATGAFGTLITSLPASPVIIPPGGYYLIQQFGGTSGFPLPTPDATGTINMSGTDGKVALVNNTTSIGVNCNAASVMDFVGYGSTANCFEGAFHAPSGSNTYAMFRLNDGCRDTDQNAPDFFTFPPNPRNSGNPPAPCVCRGDVNGDGSVNGLDVNAFAACLTAGGSCTNADVNNDTVADPGDILPMVNALLAGACAP